MSKEDSIEDLINFDPLHEAEKITGKSYKEDEDTDRLGLSLAISNNVRKEKILRNLGDTSFSMEMEDYMEVITNIGFDIVYTEEFSNPRIEHTKEKLYILFNEKIGGLAVVDSHVCSRNAASIYVNVRPKNPEHSRLDLPTSLMGTSCYNPESRIISLSLDVREALVYKIVQLHHWCDFIVPWEEKQIYVPLNHYGDDDRKGQRRRRFYALPEKVRSKIILS